MTKKHFIALADVMRKSGMMPAAVDNAIYRAMSKGLASGSEGEAIPELTDAQANYLRRTILKAVANELADFCIEQNGRFDRERWLNYIAGDCGPNGGAR